MGESDTRVSDQGHADSPPTTPATPEPENVRARFAAETQSYIVDHIRLADEKAAFFFGASAAVLYLLFNSMQKHLASPLASWALSDVVGILAMTILGIACVIGLGVVTPRLGRGGTDLIFFRAIVQFGSRDSYVKEVKALPNDELISEKLGHCYDLAKVCDRKYRALAWELRTLFLGFVLAASYFFFLAK